MRSAAGMLTRIVLPRRQYEGLRARYWWLRACWEEPAPLLDLTNSWGERLSVLRLIWAQLRGWRGDLRLRLQGVTYVLDPGAGEYYPLIEVHHDHAYTGTPGFAPAPGWRVVDVGANVGVFSVRAALAGARVLSCEPNPDCCHRMSRTVEANGLGDRVKVFNCAAGASPGMGRMKMGAFTVQGRIDRDGSIGGRSVEVRIRPLDEFVPSQMDRVDLLKIDAEGFECEVLRGATQTLALTDRVMLEYHSDALLEEATALVREHGFTPAHVVRDKGRPGLGELYARR